MREYARTGQGECLCAVHFVEQLAQAAHLLLEGGVDRLVGGCDGHVVPPSLR